MKIKHLLLLVCLQLALIINAQQNLQPNIFSLQDVELQDGPFKHALDLNIQHLLEYDVDRLLEPFLTDAGIATSAARYTNWSDLAGHVGGHYLSALAMSYASTGDSACKARLDTMITQLKACQDKNGNGYVGGIPNSRNMWNEISQGIVNATSGFELNGCWVPWYNIHKTYAGLRDAYLYAGNETAKQMFIDLCDWGVEIVDGLTNTKVQQMLAVEFGGMNEVYADAFQMTGDSSYLKTAKIFTHNTLFNAIKVRTDNLNNMHANTQIPKAVGFERVAQVDSSASSYSTAANFFWETVVNNRSLALGGNSISEHFPSASACENYIESREGPESCNTYNMLKLSQNLFCDHHDVKFVDFYERALYNHILSTQHPEHGGYVYFTSARPRHYRVYSAPNKAMWCCVGSGMESPTKHAQFIYSHDADSLYLNLFIASKINWENKNIQITQTTEFPNADSTKLTISATQATDFVLKVRYPQWVEDNQLTITINGENQSISETPGSYIALNRTWNDGDIVTITTPMHLSFEELPNVSDYIAFMYGPILLGAKTSTDALTGLVADDGRWGHIANGSLKSIYTAPIVISTKNTILNKVEKKDTTELVFTAPELFPNQSQYEDIELTPFYGIHDARYMMYWLTLTQEEYDVLIDELSAAEKEALEIDQRTIDGVATGEQQPEVDHKLSFSNSSSGEWSNEFWRDATNGGYFSYELATDGRTDLTLMVRYWGNDNWGIRTFDIFIDGTAIARETISNKWNVDEFKNVEYSIPSSLLEGKEYITVKFQATSASNTAGGVFYLRLLKSLSTEINENSLSSDDLNVSYLEHTIRLQIPSGNGIYKLFDIQGRLIKRGKINGNTTHINTSGLLSGVYLLLYPTNGTYQCKRIRID